MFKLYLKSLLMVNKHRLLTVFILLLLAAFCSWKLLNAQFNNDISIHYEKLKPIPTFNFPWKGNSFYDAMPESVQMIPAKLEPMSFNPNDDFDLIILGYPIWFLSSPIPLTTFGLIFADLEKKLSAIEIIFSSPQAK